MLFRRLGMALFWHWSIDRCLWTSYNTFKEQIQAIWITWHAEQKRISKLLYFVPGLLIIWFHVSSQTVLQICNRQNIFFSTVHTWKKYIESLVYWKGIFEEIFLGICWGFFICLEIENHIFVYLGQSVEQFECSGLQICNFNPLGKNTRKSIF